MTSIIVLLSGAGTYQLYRKYAGNPPKDGPYALSVGGGILACLMALLAGIYAYGWASGLLSTLILIFSLLPVWAIFQPMGLGKLRGISPLFLIVVFLEIITHYAS